MLVLEAAVTGCSGRQPRNPAIAGTGTNAISTFHYFESNFSAVTLFWCLAAMPPEWSTRKERLSGCPSLDKSIRDADVEFETLTSRHASQMQPEVIECRTVCEPLAFYSYASAVNLPNPVKKSSSLHSESSNGNGPNVETILQKCESVQMTAPFSMRFTSERCLSLLQDWVESNPNLMLADRPIDVVDAFVYLGTRISTCGNAVAFIAISPKLSYE
ncbi:hypothetical protein T265_06155 [Opisthorchis viverrini]|uniref:Uncharacterized protein n=1 Tax=Opisthorchis viverrini TaxID=6198 RepID=A0A074ZHF3_OPIVI|nr:hypothetical protein T265_06155 [Opisthorchis viverrini]KER26653.1 hypothetical protein T265_06155 [Opisthorchis viverrini]